jgi:hypothetical protein
VLILFTIVKNECYLLLVLKEQSMYVYLRNVFSLKNEIELPLVCERERVGDCPSSHLCTKKNSCVKIINEDSTLIIWFRD